VLEKRAPARELTRGQIAAYTAAAQKLGLPWA
jgi:hypothetical protein